MTLKVGQLAPNFEAKIETGETIKLSDYRGKKVILYFYPKDNTPGCTAQACNLRDNYDALQKAGYVIFGISSDAEKSHLKFKEKQALPFSLIADTDLKVHEAFGTWQEKNTFGKTYMGTVRTTFVIDEEGKISEIIEKVNTKDHTAQILN